MCILYLTAILKSMFSGRVYFSDAGSINAEKEMATFMFFGDFLEECKGLNHFNTL